MLRTPEGDRMLVGAEARLVQQMLGWLCFEMIETHDCGLEFAAGVARFDELLFEGQVQALKEAVQDLFGGEPLRPPVAYREAAIAAIYRVGGPVLFSTDDPGTFESLLAAFNQTLPEDEDPFVLDSETTLEDLCEDLLDRVLLDRDFELREIEDSPPEVAAATKAVVGIEPDYFAAVPPPLDGWRPGPGF